MHSFFTWKCARLHLFAYCILPDSLAGFKGPLPGGRRRKGGEGKVEKGKPCQGGRFLVESTLVLRLTMQLVHIFWDWRFSHTDLRLDLRNSRLTYLLETWQKQLSTCSSYHAAWHYCVCWNQIFLHTARPSHIQPIVSKHWRFSAF